MRPWFLPFVLLLPLSWTSAFGQHGDSLQVDSVPGAISNADAQKLRSLLEHGDEALIEILLKNPNDHSPLSLQVGDLVKLSEKLPDDVWELSQSRYDQSENLGFASKTLRGTSPEENVALGLAWRSPLFANRSVEIASLRKEALQAYLSVQRDEEVTDAADIVDRLDELSVEIILELQEAGESTLAGSSEGAARLKDLWDWLMVARSLDETVYARRRLMPVSTLESLASLHRAVVKIEVADSLDASSLRHVGTGFLVNSKVISCAHVVLDHGLDIDGKIDWPRVFVRTHSGLRIGVDGPPSTVFEEWDLIALSPRTDVQSEAVAAWMKEVADLREKKALSYATTAVDLTSAMIFGIGTLSNESGAVLIPPGQVVFPQRIRRPVRPGTSVGADRAFKQAFRAQLWGRLDNIQPTDKPITVWRAIEYVISDLLDPSPNSPAYYIDLEGRRLDLKYLAVSDALKERAGRDLRIPCFGSDLVSAGSNSGSPVLRLTGSGAVVVGVHCGRVGSGSEGRRPRLDYFKRAIPFGEAWSAVLESVCAE